MTKKASGFTLIEVLIVVAIIGILAAIAYPSYRQQVLESRRTDGYAALMACAQAQERWYTLNNKYSDDSACATSSPEGYYTVAVDVSACSTTLDCYVAVASATAKGGQNADDDCEKLTLNHLGQKNSTKADGTATSGCWID